MNIKIAANVPAKNALKNSMQAALNATVRHARNVIQDTIFKTEIAAIVPPATIQTTERNASPARQAHIKTKKDRLPAKIARRVCGQMREVLPAI